MCAHSVYIVQLRLVFFKTAKYRFFFSYAFVTVWFVRLVRENRGKIELKLFCENATTEAHGKCKFVYVRGPNLKQKPTYKNMIRFYTVYLASSENIDCRSLTNV